MRRRNVYDTDALRLLDAVAATGSFTAAAARLNYTQSAVSRRIAALEARAGGPLFDRLARGVRLTPAGQALHHHARVVLNRLARAEEELAGIHGGHRGTLRVGAFATANVALVPGALRAFADRFPDVALTPVEGPSGGLLRRMREGELDVAVVSDYPAGLPYDEDVELAELVEEELLVALPRGHRLAGGAGGEVVDLRELREETWIEAPSPGGTTMLAQACARAGFAPRATVRIAEWTGKFGYVAAGLGITLVPALAAPAVPAGLVLRSLGESAPRRTVSTALPRTPLPAARALVRLLAEAAGQ
ncbi:LysR family transcriptional regulator [Streptosporangium sandarakinum]|uniref:DNA-binding transcriptional LysR family regulator n=1 Tax=Streptosporangium sandarakinum TaxID=1260955 RepID=A0A852VCQ0_9ACTN|nr:LysR family transcriptional regulator [Streptosporangium sandarakinum]NYF43945.1 DNA-binding transcriptional LysR family regulator [Streptosporangium sandarakinum]